MATILPRVSQIAILVTCAVFLLSLCSKPAVDALSLSGEYELLSRSISGTPAAAQVKVESFSADGTVAVFSSGNETFVPNDTNGKGDIFVRDIVAATTTRANVSSAGIQADGDTVFDAASATGRYIAYRSKSTTLERPTPAVNAYYYSYVHDMQTGANELVLYSSSMNYNYMNIRSISDDGRFITALLNPGTFKTSTGSHLSVQKLFVYDRLLNTWQRLAPPQAAGAGENDAPDIFQDSSCDGTAGVFTSASHNLTTDQSTHDHDLYLYDTRGGSYKIYNLTHAFTSGPASGHLSGTARMSCSGDYISFNSTATDIDTSITVAGTGPYPYMYDRVAARFSMLARESNSGQIFSGSTGVAGKPSDLGTAILIQTEGGGGVNPWRKYVYKRDIRHNVTTQVMREQGFTTPLEIRPEANMNIFATDLTGNILLVNSNRTDLVPEVTDNYYAQLYRTRIY